MPKPGMDWASAKKFHLGQLVGFARAVGVFGRAQGIFLLLLSSEVGSEEARRPPGGRRETGWILAGYQHRAYIWATASCERIWRLSTAVEGWQRIEIRRGLRSREQVADQ